MTSQGACARRACAQEQAWLGRHASRPPGLAGRGACDPFQRYDRQRDC